MKTILKNCAIYCRKSTDEGLDSDFNTLDAQRESGEAYIASQRIEGWTTVKTSYSDGGYSGGNMDRPGLQALLADIKAGKVDIVVVYKIDRLTRSLMDFAKLVEIFDAHNVTFVSVTQSFNTTTSMGRLTLNVLLSFAQFEREVSAERIRDKIAASKKKGIWMGGNPPMGYEVKDRKLIINPEGTKIARHIFDRYCALGCVAKLKQELDSEGIVSLQRLSQRGNLVGGKPFSRGALYSILKNPIYIGKTRHKDKTYDGQHKAIINEEIWNEVQERLSGQAAAPRGHKRDPEKNLLKGLLFDCDGTPYSPDYTKKKSGKTYRYYISQNLIQYRDHPKGVMARLPATEIEKAISHAIHNHYKNTDLLCETLNLDHLSLHSAVSYITSNLPSGEDLVRVCLEKITVDQENLALKIDLTKLTIHLNKTLDLTLPAAIENFYTLNIPFTTRRAHRGAIIISPDNQNKDLTDLPPTELKNLLRGIIWRDEHFNGTSIRAIARRENLSESGIRKIIMRSFDTLLSL